jgi:hypothetical protein
VAAHRPEHPAHVTSRVWTEGCIVGLALLVALVGCGQQPIQADSATNGGVIPIAQAATYTWEIGGTCFGQGGASFRLVSDTGRVDYLTSGSGSIYLATGNWTGEAGVPLPGSTVTPPTFDAVACTWSLTLTPNG